MVCYYHYPSSFLLIFSLQKITVQIKVSTFSNEINILFVIIIYIFPQTAGEMSVVCSGKDVKQIVIEYTSTAVVKPKLYISIRIKGVQQFGQRRCSEASKYGLKVKGYNWYI